MPGFPEVENWEQCGFPDDLYFRPYYTPMIGLIKATNERLAAVDLEEIPLPKYFSEYSYYFLDSLNDIIFGIFGIAWKYVNPDKISSAHQYQDCFWTDSELEEAAAEDGEPYYHYQWPFSPDYPVKLAVQMYNAINILRYVPTSDPSDWPDVFTYADRYNTFNFKA